MTNEDFAAFAEILHKRADALRERAIVAEQQRGGSTENDVVDRWVSSFATAYQTLRGIAHSCEDMASRQKAA